MLCEPQTNNYLSMTWPKASQTAPWQKENTTCTNWLVSHSSEIEYSFNSHGYRDKEWTNEQLSGIWCIGDSQTVGMGVAKEYIWSSLLGNNTVNLGIAGASNDTLARILCSCMQHQRPQAVCVLLTAPNRREIINQIGCSTLFPHITKTIGGINLRLFEEFLNSTDPISDSINRDKNILLMKFCCRSYNIPIVVADFDMALRAITKKDVAADGLHIGPATHRFISNFFRKKLVDLL